MHFTLAPKLAAAGAFAAILLLGAPVRAQSMPAGGPDSVAYAAKLWQALKAARLVGPDAIVSRPYGGTDPHGKMLEVFKTTLKMDGREAMVIVKRNYGPAGVTADQILADRLKHLGAITVMFKREAGYDTENQDWFWAKYLKDGTLDKNPKGMQLAGRVGKGSGSGCIPCHGIAPDGDMSYIYNLRK